MSSRHTYIFQKDFTFEERCEKYRIIHEKHQTNLIPIICEYDVNLISGKAYGKFLIWKGFQLGQLIEVVRKRIKLQPDEAIFLLINNRMVSLSLSIENIYEQYKDADNFLYIRCTKENVFG